MGTINARFAMTTLSVSKLLVSRLGLTSYDACNHHCRIEFLSSRGQLHKTECFYPARRCLKPSSHVCALSGDSRLAGKGLRWIFQQRNEAVYGLTGWHWDVITPSFTGVQSHDKPKSESTAGKIRSTRLATQILLKMGSQRLHQAGVRHNQDC